MQDLLILAVDARGAITLVEGSLANSLGRVQNPTVGRSVFEVLLEPAWIGDTVRRALAGASTEFATSIGRTEVSARCGPRRAENTIVGALLVVTPLAAPRARDPGRRERREMRRLFEQLPGAVWATNLDLRITHAIGRVVDGVPLVQSSGHTIAEFVGSNDPDNLAIKSHRAALAGEKCRYRYDLGTRCYEASVEPLRDHNGEISGTIGVAIDVTERRLADRQLAESEARLATTQQVAHLGSWEWDIGLNVVTWSDELYRIYGIGNGDFAGTLDAYASRLHPDDRESALHAVQAGMREGKPFEFDHRIVRSDGDVRMLYTRAEVIAGDGDRRTRLVSTCWDITDRWKAARKLDESVSLSRATFEATADGLLVIDRVGKVRAFNQRFLTLWRIPPEIAATGDDETLMGAAMEQLEDPASFATRVRELYEQHEAESFDVIRFRDGRTFERFSLPQRVGGEIVGRVWSFRDVTEREESLRSAHEAIHAREEFLAIAAHEIRGPLSSLHLAAQLLTRPEASPEIRARSVEIITREDRRLARFVDELLDVARMRSGQMRFELSPVDIAEVTRVATSRLASNLAHSGSTLLLSADGAVIGMWDRERLDQVVTNLVTNAVKFGKGQPIEVTLAADNGVAKMMVRDHGIGIPEQERTRIFGAFERAVGSRYYGGLGLGLYIVRTIVTGLGGSVRVESELGRGTTFLVELPMTSPVSAQAAL